MTDSEQIKSEIILKTKVFYDSIENQFNYKEKHYTKYRILDVVMALSFLLFAMNLAPFIPYFIKDSQWIIKKSITLGSLSIPLEFFLARWIVFASITGILYLIIKTIRKAFKKRETKYSITNKHLSFAYLYKAIKELEIFLVNDRKEHTQTSLKYLKLYIESSFLSYLLQIGDTGRISYLPKFLLELQEKRSWIEFSDTSSLIIGSFSQIEEKLYKRINQQIQIDLVIEILNYILAFEYILLDKVKVEILPSIINDNKLATKLMIKSSAEKIKELTDIENTNEDTKAILTLDRLNKVSNEIAGLFSNHNLLITFFSWMILLGLIFSALIYIGQSFYKIKIDSTMYIGAVSGIILGALTISATIYSKRK